MQLPMFFVRPAKWKKYFNLINSQKDASRTRAIEIFPYFSTQLSKKKDSNKADAILISSFFASLIQTNFFNTDIESRKFYTVNNQFIVYDLYKPKHVSENNKMPFIVIVPGFQRSKEALSNFAIELSRRDIVVALIDPYAQGLSSSSLQNRSATKEGYGMFDLVAHVYESKEFNYIDKNRIGTTGHSMGGNAALRGANFFAKEAEKLNKKSKLHSIYVLSLIHI